VPVTLSRNVATLSGVVSVDDAEPLAQWLRDTARPKVKLAGCIHLHTAVLQALLAARPSIASAPTEPFLARWIFPLLVPPPVPTAADEEIR
jgi:hypothetical protein